jgi:hypothetical protein
LIVLEKEKERGGGMQRWRLELEMLNIVELGERGGGKDN